MPRFHPLRALLAMRFAPKVDDLRRFLARDPEVAHAVVAAPWGGHAWPDVIEEVCAALDARLDLVDRVLAALHRVEVGVQVEIALCASLLGRSGAGLGEPPLSERFVLGPRLLALAELASGADDGDLRAAAGGARPLTPVERMHLDHSFEDVLVLRALRLLAEHDRPLPGHALPVVAFAERLLGVDGVDRSALQAWITEATADSAAPAAAPVRWERLLVVLDELETQPGCFSMRLDLWAPGGRWLKIYSSEDLESDRSAAGGLTLEAARARFATLHGPLSAARRPGDLPPHVWFVLPRSLACCPVEAWGLQVPRGRRRPFTRVLGPTRPVVVALRPAGLAPGEGQDRLDAAIRRWRHVRDAPGLAHRCPVEAVPAAETGPVAAVVRAEGLSEAEYGVLDAHKQVVCALLDGPPPPPDEEQDLVEDLYFLGLPAALWTTDAGGLPDGLLDDLSSHPPAELPELVCGWRRRHDAGPRLTLYWDDPHLELPSQADVPLQAPL